MTYYDEISQSYDSLHSEEQRRKLKLVKELLEKHNIKITKSMQLLDVGCGMGRVLAIAAHSGFRRIIGIDLSEKMCRYSASTAQRLMKQQQGISIAVTRIDAFDYDIPDTVGVLFLFNPFDEIIMQGFLEQLKLSLQRQPRPIKVLYANCQCKDLWLNAGFIISYSFCKMEFLEGVVFTYQPQ